MVIPALAFRPDPVPEVRSQGHPADDVRDDLCVVDVFVGSGGWMFGVLVLSWSESAEVRGPGAGEITESLGLMYVFTPAGLPSDSPEHGSQKM